MRMECTPKNGSLIIQNLINGNFHLEKGHKLAWEIMQQMKEKFDPNGRFNQIGPLLVTSVAQSLFKLPKPLTNVNGKVWIILTKPYMIVRNIVL